MTLRKYIMENTENTLIDNKEFYFNDSFRLYCAIKKCTLKAVKEYRLKLFNYENRIYLLNDFESNKLDSVLNFINNEINNDYKEKFLGENFIIKSKNDLLFYVFISCISNAAEKMNTHKYAFQSQDKIIAEMRTFIDNIRNINIDNWFEEIEKMNNLYIQNHQDLKNLYQIGKYYEEKNEFKYLLNCPKVDNLFYKYFLLELVYYGYFYNENPKLEKICPICKNPYYTKGKTCNNCAKKEANHRRKYNAKCGRRRNKIKNYLGRYDISDKLAKKADEFINLNNKNHNDLKQLEKIVSDIEKELRM